MRQFLEAGQLGLIINETLFVHGGLIGYFETNEILDTLGCIPGKENPSQDVHQWVEELNAWLQSQLQEWKSTPTWKKVDGDATRIRGGEALMDYVVPGLPPTVVLARHLDKKSNPTAFPQHLSKKLVASGIKRLVVGHTPHGISPTVIKDKDFEILMCDTSFSDMTKPDNRGIAACQVLIDGSVSRINGTLPDGGEIDFSLSLEDKSPSFDPYIGKEVGDGFWVKAKLKETPKDGKNYLLFNVNGYSYTYKYVSKDEIELQLK